MDDLIIDLDRIRRISEEQEDENWRFRRFLKSDLKWDDDRLDDVVLQTAQSVSARIDCTACANCCHTMGVTVNDEDIARMAERLGSSVEDLDARCVRDEEGSKLIAESPCPFLDGSLCSIYEARPKDCREFPHLDKGDLRSRSIELIANASECPIVFNTLQRLKKRLP